MLLYQPCQPRFGSVDGIRAPVLSGLTVIKGRLAPMYQPED